MLGRGVVVEGLGIEVLSSIIADIYDCVLNPEGWSGVMTRITEAVDAAYSTIALARTADNHGRFMAQSPWDPAQMRVLQEDYDFDGIPGLKAAVVGDIDTPVTTLSLMSEAELQLTAFFGIGPDRRDCAKAVSSNSFIRRTESGSWAAPRGPAGGNIS